MENIASELRSLETPIDRLTPWAELHPDGNPRKGDVEAIAASLDAFGQVKPIVVQAGTGAVVAGNHTLAAAKVLGWTKIAAVRVAMDDDEATRYLLADNRTNDLASNDNDMLLSVLEDLQDRGLLEGTGYSPDDVDDLIALMERVEETQVEEFQGDYAEAPEVTAARWEGRDEGQRREVVFLLDHERYEQFKEAVTSLKSKYDTESMALAIFEAVRREAAQTMVTVTEGTTEVWNGDEPTEPEPVSPEPEDPNDVPF